MANDPQPDPDHKEQLTVVLRGPAVTPTPTPRAQARPAVPGYEILEELGRGGMGVVYKARDRRLGREVALKLILAGGRFAPADVLTRFRLEAEAAARLQHPNIVQVFEVGACPDGPFLAMELAPGGTLAGRLKGPVPPRDAAVAARSLARAIHAAHSQGFVHRDLKPANVLVIEGPGTALGDCTLKVSDFGLVLRLDEERQTRPGQVMGTPGYMAPEQAAAGPGQPIGPAVDVYAIGAMLYEMLTGRLPFQGSSAVETLALMLASDAPRPTKGVALPRDLETVCLKCLHKDPAKRYASAAELADDLGRWLEGRPIRARRTPLWERAAMWARRQPLAATLAGLLALTAALAFGCAVWLWLRAEAARGEASASADAERQARMEAQALAARLLLDQGAHRCERGDAAGGLLWLDRARRDVPDSPVAASTGRLIAGWAQSLHRLAWHAPMTGPVGHVAYSADGSRLAAAHGQQVKVFDTDGRPAGAATLPGAVLHLAAHAGGLVAVVESARELRLHAVPGGEALGRAVPLEGRPRGVALHPDGRRVLVGYEGGKARVHDLSSGMPALPEWTHEKTVRAVAFSPDGRRAAAGDDAGVVRVYALEDGAEVSTLRGHAGPVVCVAFSPDSKSLVSGGEDHRALVWRREGGRERMITLTHQHGVCAAAFLPGGRALATASWDKTVCLWDAEGRQLATPIRHPDDPCCLAARPDGLRLATGCDDARLRVWEVPAPDAATATLRHPTRVNALALSPDGRRMVTATSDDAVCLHEGGRRTAVLPIGAVCVAAAFSADGGLLALGCLDGGVHFIDVENVASMGEPLWFESEVASVAWSPGGTLAIGCKDPEHRVTLWDGFGKPLRHLSGHRRKVAGLAWSPDGSLLASASWDRTVRLWRVGAETSHVATMTHGDLAQSVSFSPDGALLASGGDDYTCRVWDVRTGKPAGPPMRAPDKIQMVAFGAAGLVATADRGGRVCFWDALTGRLAGAPRWHRAEARAVAAEPDGRAFWSASWDGTACRWQALPEGPAPDRRWLELHAGQRLDVTGSLEVLGAAEWVARAAPRP